MRVVDIETVEPGHYLGKTIYAMNGTVLLSAGVQLTVYMINTLKRIGVTSIYIKDPLTEDIELEEILSEETKRALIRNMSETMNEIRSGKPFNSRSLSLAVDDLLEDVLQHREVLIQLNEIRTQDNAEFVHAMNVCMVATLVGLNMDLNAQQLKELATGSLLHDVGKAIAAKAGEGDTPRHHAWLGFELLKARRELSLLIAHVALQHHEHTDGTGAPRGLVGDQIHLYSRIVAVANMYDNLLQQESDGRFILPHDACERMLAMSGKELDHEVLVHFMQIVSLYPNGISVRLSTRETGVVVGQHRGLPGRPVIRLLAKEGENHSESREIDLAKTPTVFIEQVLS
ncbi:HD-GYP domain-containing protein [Paenibacillus mendelii]|uniref:HD-GYP domain-containing protein n=1 Tax=Paenibacillus mendelii TaxID=206163 RepID=A0ABV6JCT4_9BACL|nr:HD domain-containing phosphohydrolase [Paenibacillus mendelii]MCQ6562535.1 HD domain-containing protein [Paenibacillus mendelii]